MVEDRSRSFSTEELRQLYPMLATRIDQQKEINYVIFSNPNSCSLDTTIPEWPVGLEFWVPHKHECNVDGNIYDPLTFYGDRRGLTESLTGSVYGQIATMAENLTQQLFGGYKVEVLFGEYRESAGLCKRFIVDSPYGVERALKQDPDQTKHILIRVTHDRRKCATSPCVVESHQFSFRSYQFAKDGFRRYEFFIYPLSDSMHSARAQVIAVADYVHYYAAIYDSVIMAAHHDAAR